MRTMQPVPSTALLAAAMIALSVVTVVAQPKTKPAEPVDCPDWTIEVVHKRADQAQTCEDAHRVLRQCAAGGTSDGALATTVVEKCEAEFLARLKPSEKRTYNRRHDACAEGNRSEKGSLGLSLRAICAADNARAFAKRYGRPETK